MSSQVVTVTFNPALDYTVLLEVLTPGHVHRAQSERLEAGGKGVNVASCLGDWGVDTAVTGILGSGNAAVFERLFERKGIADHFVRVDGKTRTNIKLIDARNRDTTDINLPGASCEPRSFTAVRSHFAALCDSGGVAVLSGSLPAGLEEGAYARLIDDAAPWDTRVVLDTSGAPLTAALAAQRKPYAIKPNCHELEELCGRSLPDVTDVLRAARELTERGIELVVVSLGRRGAVFVRNQRAVLARVASIEPLSTVGAGDAMVAGMVAALIEDADLERIARLATAFAVGKLADLGAHLPSRDHVLSLAEGVHIELMDYGSQG